MAYFSAAGNNGTHSYESDYRSGTLHAFSSIPSVVGAPSFAGGTAHDFDAGGGVDEFQHFTLLAGQSITLSFQWDQSFASVTGGAGATTDMDIYVLNSAGQIVAGSIDDNINADPVEILTFENTSPVQKSYDLLIVKNSGPDPNRLKYINITNGNAGMGNLEYDTDSSTLYGHANTMGALAVGAAAWNATPEFGVSPPTLRGYSSQGGTGIRISPVGQVLASPVVYNKPDVVAPDGGNNTFFGIDSAYDADSLPNFPGTSAAAAHAAGAAALIRQSSPNASPAAIYAAFRNTTVDMAAAGFDFQSGYGLLDAEAASAIVDQLALQISGAPALSVSTWSGGADDFGDSTPSETLFGGELVPVDRLQSYRLSSWGQSGDGGVFQTLTYQWVQTSGPVVELSGANMMDATFTALRGYEDYHLSFDVIVNDGSTNITESISVTVPRVEPLVRFRLEAVDLQGNPIVATEVGEQFQLFVYAEDLTTPADGLYASYLDVAFNAQLATALAITYWGSDFGAGHTGTLLPGLIDEAGGRSGTTTPSGGGERFLFSALLQADAPGALVLQSNSADNLPAGDVLLFGQDDAVDPDYIDYGKSTLQILPGGYASGTITTINLATNSDSIPEDNASSAIVTIDVTADGPDNLIVDFAGSATPDDNYYVTDSSGSPFGGTITLEGSGSTYWANVTLYVYANSDSLVEGDETIEISVGTEEVTITIKDEDQLVEFVKSEESVTEGASVMIEVTLIGSGMDTDPVTVTLEAAPKVGTQPESSDYIITPDTFVLTPNSVETQIVIVEAVSDGIIDPNEVFVLKAKVNGEVNDTIDVTIIDDGEEQPKLNITATDGQAKEPFDQYYCNTTEDKGEFKIWVEGWDGTSPAVVTFSIAASSTAESGDYSLSSRDAPTEDLLTNNGDGTYTIVLDDNEAFITLTAIVDSDEDDETVTLVLADPPDMELVTSQATGNITDADPEGLMLEAPDPDAAEEGQLTGEFLVTGQDPGKLLCTTFRLVIDATGALLPDTDVAYPQNDYTLQYPLLSPLSLELVDPPVPGKTLYRTQSITLSEINALSSVTIYVKPIDDTNPENDERVIAWIKNFDQDIDTVTIQQHPLDLPDATLRPYVTPDNECSCSCQTCAGAGVVVEPHTGQPKYVPAGMLGGFLQYVGDGTLGTQQIVRAELARPSSGTWPSQIDVTIELDDWFDELDPNNSMDPMPSPTFTLKTNSYTDDTIAFAVPVDFSGLANSSYRVQLKAFDHNNVTATWKEAEASLLVNSFLDNSLIAPGWAFPFEKRILGTPMYVYDANGAQETSGVALFHGDGAASWYQGTGGTYETPAESVSELTFDPSNLTYTLMDRYGMKEVFHGDSNSTSNYGRLWKKIDSNGNETIFSYGSDGLISKITDPLLHETEITRTMTGTGWNITITDFAERETKLEYNTAGATPFLKISHPDPDVNDENGVLLDRGDPLFEKLVYDAQNRLSKITLSSDGVNFTTGQQTIINYGNEDYGYGPTWGRVSSVERDTIDGSAESTWLLAGYGQNENLPNRAIGTAPLTWSPAYSNVAIDLDAFNYEAITVDGNVNQSTAHFDHRGRLIEAQDPHLQSYFYSRKPTVFDEYGNYLLDLGEVTTFTTPDPDGSDPTLSAQVTSFGYDALLNVTSRTLPPLANPVQPLSWDGFVHGSPGQMTDELGNSTTFGRDSSANLTQMTAFAPAAKPNQWQNPFIRRDVNFDTFVSPVDALQIINELNSPSLPSGQLPDNYNTAKGFFDVNGDRHVSPVDVLQVINFVISGASVVEDAARPTDYAVSYTYTPGPSVPDSFVNGLLLTETVTTGRNQDLVTQYTYYPLASSSATSLERGRSGQLHTVTYAQQNSHVSGTITYDYDEFGNVASVEEQVNDSANPTRTTTFLYDKLNRLIEVTTPDPDGSGLEERSATTEYAYDAFGNLSRVTQKNYDPILAVETSHTSCMYYDNRNRLTWSVEPDPDADTSATSCNATPPVTPPVAWTNSEFPAAWSDRPVFHFAYDKNNNLLEMTDPRGNTTSYEYDALDRLVKVREPAPGLSHVPVSGDNVDASGRPVTDFIYDNLGNLWSVTDALGNTTDYRYDEWNRIKTITAPDPDGSQGPDPRPVTQFSYVHSQYGWITRVTDAEGRVTESQTDFLGRLQYVAEPAPVAGGVRPVTWYGYYADGALASVRDPQQNSTQYGYDDRARLVTITAPDPDGTTGPLLSPVTSYTYDLANQLTEVKDPLNCVTTYNYDNAGRVEEVISPDPLTGEEGANSPITTYRYDAIGNLLEISDEVTRALGFVNRYGYDHLFRRTEETDGKGQTTVFGYDLVGNMKTLTDPNDNVTTWMYDDLDRVMDESIVINSVTLQRAYKYDAVGNEREMRDRLGRVTTYGYDALYRRTSESWDDAVGTVFNYSYDLVGNLLSASDVNSATYGFTYDDLDRLNVETQNINGLSTMTLDHDYDLIGNRTLLSVMGNTADFMTSYAYDKLYRTTSVTQQGTGVAPKRVTFSYDVASQLTDVKRYAANTAAAGSFVAQSRYGYDLTGRVRDITHVNDELATGERWDGFTDPSVPDNLIAAYFLEYDKANRLDKFSSQADQFWADYGYDDRNQLTGATYKTPTNQAYLLNGASIDETYVFDDNGNRDSVTLGSSTDDYTLGEDNRLTSNGQYTFTYDAEGNRIAKFIDGQAQGQSGYGEFGSGDTDITEYKWDHRNRLTGITQRAAYADAIDTAIIDYEYDVFDRRISKTVDDDGTGGQPAQHDLYVLDGSYIVLEFHDPDADGSAPAVLSHRYVHGPGTDMILADEKIVTVGVAGEVLWALADHLGSVRDVIDSNADVQFHIQYDTFGREVARYGSNGQLLANASSVQFIYGYTGQERDVESDLYYYNRRYYAVTEGLFISNDAIGFAGDPSNLARYVENQPTTRTDPSGLQDPIQENRDFYERLGEDRRTPHPALVREAAERQAAWDQYSRDLATYRQNLLDYYRRIMREMILVGDKLWESGLGDLPQPYRSSGYICANDKPGSSGKLYVQLNPNSVKRFFPIMWPRLGSALEYALSRNGKMGFFGVHLVGRSSSNIMFIPGIDIDREAFYAAEDEAIAALAHEPQHDFKKHGFDLKMSWPDYDHEHIRGMFSNTPNALSDNDYGLFIDFLQTMKCGDGTSLWSEILGKAGPRPTAPPKPTK
ncbi:MAG: dockerin type I domain-containing protein [Planctomycetota bacterium]|nr:dockerin type I domain-containing protein [Planctomycetota bacterium]